MAAKEKPKQDLVVKVNKIDSPLDEGWHDAVIIDVSIAQVPPVLTQAAIRCLAKTMSW